MVFGPYFVLKCIDGSCLVQKECSKQCNFQSTLKLATMMIQCGRAKGPAVVSSQSTPISGLTLWVAGSVQLER
jgi:hypothetical protein